FFVDLFAVAMFGKIAFRLAQFLAKLRLEIVALHHLASQLDGPTGVLDYLHCLDARELVEKPAAARIHQHRVALHFKQLESPHSRRLVEFVNCVPGKKAVYGIFGPVENNVDIVVARSPWIFEQILCLLLELGRNSIAQPIQRLSQRRKPLLIPSGMPAGITAAVGPPALDSMYAAPRGVFNDLRQNFGRMHLEELPVINQLSLAAGLNAVQSVTQRHLAIMMMVTVTLAVRCDVAKLRPIALIGKAAEEPVSKPLPIIKQPFECDGLRNRPIIKKDIDRFFGRKLDLIGTTRIDSVSSHIFPVSAAHPAHSLRLARR